MGVLSANNFIYFLGMHAIPKSILFYCNLFWWKFAEAAKNSYRRSHVICNSVPILENGDGGSAGHSRTILMIHGNT